MPARYPLMAEPAGPPAAPPLSRRQRLKAQTRKALYQSALRLFAERGLAAATVQDITLAAGVAKGTFFSHFRTKEEVFQPFFETLLANVAEVLRDVDAAVTGVRLALRHLFERNAREFGRDPVLIRALFSSIFLNETVRGMMAEAMASGRRDLVRIIAAGQKSGEIRADRDPRAMALAFQQALLGAVLVWAVRPAGSLSRRVETSFGDFWAAIAANGKGRPAPGTGRSLL